MSTSRSLLLAALLLGGAGPLAGTPVPLRVQPNSPLDAAARRLQADDLADARSRGEAPLVLVGTANLGFPRPALFVQLQSAGECGSGGCTTAVYAWDRGRWQRVLDGTAGKLAVGTHRTRGRADLLTDDDHFVWNGSAYQSAHPAPALDLRPRRGRASSG